MFVGRLQLTFCSISLCFPFFRFSLLVLPRHLFYCFICSLFLELKAFFLKMYTQLKLLIFVSSNNLFSLLSRWSILNCPMVAPVPNKVGKYSGSGVNGLFSDIASFVRRCLFRVLSMGPIPSHLAFIMDGNRRYAKKQNLEEGDGHKAGYLALMSLLHYCYELGIKYVTRSEERRVGKEC